MFHSNVTVQELAHCCLTECVVCMYYIWRSVGTIPPYTWTYIHMYNTYMPPPPPPPATYLPIGTRIMCTHKYIFIRVPSIVTCSPPVQESEPVPSRPSLLLLASHPPKTSISSLWIYPISSCISKSFDTFQIEPSNTIGFKCTLHLLALAYAWNPAYGAPSTRSKNCPRPPESINFSVRLLTLSKPAWWGEVAW